MSLFLEGGCGSCVLTFVCLSRSLSSPLLCLPLLTLWICSGWEEDAHFQTPSSAGLCQLQCYWDQLLSVFLFSEVVFA